LAPAHEGWRWRLFPTPDSALDELAWRFGDFQEALLPEPLDRLRNGKRAL
jgi:hypothetical protein